VKVFVPLDIASHSYLELLYSNLGDKGVQSYGLSGVKDLKNILKADVIHLHWIEFFIRTPGSLLLTSLKFIFWIILLTSTKYFLSKKIVITLHNIKPHESVYPNLENFGFNYYFKIANAIIVHNEWSKKQVSMNYKNLKGKIHVVPHGNFVGYYPNQISKKEARDILGIPQDAFTILYFGKIKKYKGLVMLLSALKDIIDDDVWFVICGKPEDEKISKDLLEFNEQYNNSILKLHYIPDIEIQIYMNSCDVGILPYEDITTSGSLILFGSFKRTVIIPHLEPIKETVGDDVIYYMSGDINNLKEKIYEAKNGDLSKKDNNIYSSLLQYDWGHIASKTKNIYQNIKRC